MNKLWKSDAEVFFSLFLLFAANYATASDQTKSQVEQSKASKSTKVPEKKKRPAKAEDNYKVSEK